MSRSNFRSFFFYFHCNSRFVLYYKFYCRVLCLSRYSLSRRLDLLSPTLIDFETSPDFGVDHNLTETVNVPRSKTRVSSGTQETQDTKGESHWVRFDGEIGVHRERENRHSKSERQNRGPRPFD